MSEEEKEAIENAKQILNETTFLADIGHKDLEILLNLIEKQQKEIENSVSVNKITKKIEEILRINRHKKKKDSEVEYAIDILKELEKE